MPYSPISRVHIIEQVSGINNISLKNLALKEIKDVEIFSPKLSKLELKEYHSYFKESDAFIILPNSNPLIVASMLVDRQYSDVAAAKPVIVLEVSGMKNPWVELVKELKINGFVSQDIKRLFTYVTNNASEVAGLLEKGLEIYKDLRLGSNGEKVSNNNYPIDAAKAFVKKHNKESKWYGREKPVSNICVFCSNSTKDKKFLNQAYNTGEIIANKSKGFVFGGSNRSMMNMSAKGAMDNNSYVTGITTPTFIGKELITGEEMHIDTIEIVEDIYIRMHDMFASSEALVVLAGGLGTVQEVIASFKMREEHKEMRNKKIILVNEYSFWDRFVDILETSGYKKGQDFEVVSNLEELAKIV